MVCGVFDMIIEKNEDDIYKYIAVIQIYYFLLIIYYQIGNKIIYLYKNKYIIYIIRLCSI
jgi:hypothetical protein